jgi:hypothetical protein
MTRYQVESKLSEAYARLERATQEKNAVKVAQALDEIEKLLAQLNHAELRG